MDNKNIYMVPIALAAAYFLAGPALIVALCALTLLIPATILKFWVKVFKWTWSRD
jgi:hypothetical protein